MHPKYLIILLFALSFISCKKNDGDGKCRLKTARIKLLQYDATTTVDYDDQGRVIKTTTAGTANKTNTFTYVGDTIKIVESTGSSSSTHTLLKNSDGNIRDLFIRNSQGAISIKVHYDYNSAGKVIKQTTIYGSGTPLVYSIAYNSAGDASNETNTATGSTSIYHDYYTDKEYQIGDAEGITDFLSYGATAVTNNHLLKTTTSTSGTSAPTVIRNTYSFDDAGRISNLTQTVGTSTDTSTYDYTYRCE